MECLTPDMYDILGYVSDKYLKKIEKHNFDSSYYGSYMDEVNSGNISYSIATIEEKDSMILMKINDYTAPDEVTGSRGQTTHVYAGEKIRDYDIDGLFDFDGIVFTNYLYPYNENVSVKEQCNENNAINPYFFITTGNEELRSSDRILKK